MQTLFKTKFSTKTAIVILLCHIGIALYFYKKGADYNVYYWAAGFMLIASLPYINAVRKNKFIFYEAIYLYFAGLVINYMSFTLFKIEELQYSLEVLSYVVRLVCLGAITLLLGYKFGGFLPLARRLPVKNFIITDTTLVKLPTKLYLIGWALRLLNIFTVGIRSFGGWQILNILMRTSVYVAIMIDAYLYFYHPDIDIKIKKWKHLVRFLLFIVIEVIFGFLSGMRENIFMPVAFVFLTYIKAKKRIPFIAIAIAGFLFVNFVMPFTGAFRTQYWHGEELERSLKYAFEYMSDKKSSYEIEEKSIQRISNSLYIATVCTQKRLEDIRIKTYETITDYISRFIPRFIWPNKPIVDYNRIGKELGIINPDDYSTSVGITLIAGFILDNGVLGVIVGMFFVGMLLKIYWKWLMVRTNENIFASIIYFNLIYTLMRDEEFFIILHSNIAFLVYTYILLSFIKRK